MLAVLTSSDAAVTFSDASVAFCEGDIALSDANCAFCAGDVALSDASVAFCADNVTFSEANVASGMLCPRPRMGGRQYLLDRPQCPIPRYPWHMGIQTLSVILPAKNEAEGLRRTLPALRLQFRADIIVVDDGSTDDTAAVAAELGAMVLSAPYSMGNGAAIKRGTRAASGDVLVFMDADGQHAAEHIAALLKKLDEGFDMVVGARDRSGEANAGRGLANAFYNRLASWMTGHKIMDLTSGFRAVRTDKFREFLHLLPNGFSYPTTSTMAFFRSAYPVAYVPIPVGKRVGINSHIRMFRDGVRFLLIIFKIATYIPR